MEFLPTYSPAFNFFERRRQHLKNHCLDSCLTKRSYELSDKIFEFLGVMIATQVSSAPSAKLIALSPTFAIHQRRKI